ncbi:FAD-binding monooxygenase, partial [Saccharothrix sp. ST-888]
ADRRPVTGARLQRQAGASPEVRHPVLFVDITARASRTPLSLEELPYPRREETRVKIDLPYTTRHFQLDADPFGDDLAIIPVATPAHPRGAFFYRLPGEDN